MDKTHIGYSAEDLRGFQIKDSGKRADMGGGGVRDTEEGKLDYTLIMDGPMFDRWAAHLTKGAVKYEARNWLKFANGSYEEVIAAKERCTRSLFRHIRQYWRGDKDEDHAAAIFFNINAVEYLREALAVFRPWSILRVNGTIETIFVRPGTVVRLGPGDVARAEGRPGSEVTDYIRG